MIFGDKNELSIECYHDPHENNNRWVFGRMCIWCSGKQLGDVTEPACMLNVTEGFLQDLLHNPGLRDGGALNEMADRQLFDYLNEKIYLDDDRRTHEVEADARKYFKYDFLTNGGESFDSHKSFLVKDGDVFRLLFMDNDGNFESCRVNVEFALSVVEQFLSWLENEKNG